MEPHVHFSAVHAIGVLLLVFIAFGTAHLLALSSDSRPARALVALGF